MVPAIWAQNAPVYLVTYAQALFAKAEAAKLGRIAGGDAEVEGSYNQASNSRCNNGRIVLQAQQIFSTRKVCRITQTQCWVHLFIYGYEGGAERRHTGNPANMVDPMGKRCRQCTATGTTKLSTTHRATTKHFKGSSAARTVCMAMFSGISNR